MEVDALYVYIVKLPFHSKDEIPLKRGDALTEEDARWLELPENLHLMPRVTRLPAHRIDAGQSASAQATDASPAAAVVAQNPTPPPAAAPAPTAKTGA
jgi:hypothetical protein